MSDQARIASVREKLRAAGDLYTVKPGETSGLYSVTNPLMPRIQLTAWENLSVEQLEDLAENLVAMWKEGEERN